MTLPEWLRAVLPAQTQDAWERVRDVLTLPPCPRSAHEEVVGAYCA